MIKINNIVDKLPVHVSKIPDVLYKPIGIIVHTTEKELDPHVLAKYNVTPSSDNHLSSTGAPSISYHYLTNPDGRVLKTQNEDKVVWHAKGFNSTHLGVAVNYQASPVKDRAFLNKKGKPDYPTQEAMDSLINLLTYLCIKFAIVPDKIRGHREMLGTGYKIVNSKRQYLKTCPGMGIDLDKLRLDVSKKLQSTINTKASNKLNIDGVFGPKSIRALKNFIDLQLLDNDILDLI